MLLLRTIFFTLLFPGSVTVLIPYFLITSDPNLRFPSNAWLGLGGLILIIAGYSGLLTCIREFYTVGQGTLAAIDPPKKLVVKGLYRYVRNPMYVSVITVLLGESIFFWSVRILWEALIFGIIVNIYVRFFEEPKLQSEFGREYQKYTQSVRRWIPGARYTD